MVQSYGNLKILVIM